MEYQHIVLVIVILLLIIWWRGCDRENSTAKVEEVKHVRKEKRTSSLPPGNYEKKCSGISFHDDVLKASCRARNQQFVSSSVDTKKCRKKYHDMYEIINDNGKLRCVPYDPLRYDDPYTYGPNPKQRQEYLAENDRTLQMQKH